MKRSLRQTLRLQKIVQLSQKIKVLKKLRFWKNLRRIMVKRKNLRILKFRKLMSRRD